MKKYKNLIILILMLILALGFYIIGHMLLESLFA